MAYTPDYLSGPYMLGSKGGTQLYAYATDDNAAAVAGSGYISDAGEREMKAGDIVIVTQRATLPSGAATGVSVYVVSGVSSGAATIIKTATS